jgi:hypothetical protein
MSWLATLWMKASAMRFFFAEFAQNNYFNSKLPTLPGRDSISRPMTPQAVTRPLDQGSRQESSKHFSLKNLPLNTLAGFDLTTHCSNLLGGKRRYYHLTTEPGQKYTHALLRSSKPLMSKHKRLQTDIFG